MESSLRRECTTWRRCHNCSQSNVHSTLGWLDFHISVTPTTWYLCGRAEPPYKAEIGSLSLNCYSHNMISLTPIYIPLLLCICYCSGIHSKQSLGKNTELEKCCKLSSHCVCILCHRRWVISHRRSFPPPKAHQCFRRGSTVELYDKE